MTSTKQLDVSDCIQERSDFVSSTHSHPPTPEKKRTKKTNQISNQQHLLSMAISNMVLTKSIDTANYNKSNSLISNNLFNHSDKK